MSQLDFDSAAFGRRRERQDIEHWCLPPLSHVNDLGNDAIDAALRSVALPEGLLTRLGRLVYTMPDETADCNTDWLGC